MEKFSNEVVQWTRKSKSIWTNIFLCALFPLQTLISTACEIHQSWHVMRWQLHQFEQYVDFQRSPKCYKFHICTTEDNKLCHSLPVTHQLLQSFSTALPPLLTPALAQLISTPVARPLQSAAAACSLLCHCETQMYFDCSLLPIKLSANYIKDLFFNK